jgi:hypothetical protein
MTVDFYGFQVEAGSVASSYVPTTSAPVTRDADVLTASNGLLWSNVVESDALDGALWNSATAYTVGQVVRRPNHRRYSALKASTNAIPENTATGDAAATWQDIGPTQRFAVFDQKYSTVATNPEVVQYLVKPGTISQAVAALGLDGSDVRVSVVDGNTGALVYQRTNSLRVKNCRSIVEYLTKPISRRADDVFDDLPPFKNALILLTVTKPGSVAKLSDVIVGRVEYAGEMQWKPEIRTLRRSVIKDDGFGNLTFTKRRSSKLISADVTVDSNLVDDTVRVLNGYTDQPCVIIGDKRWTALIILGYVKDFRLVLEYEGQAGAIYNAQIEGFA